MLKTYVSVWFNLKNLSWGTGHVETAIRKLKKKMFIMEFFVRDSISRLLNWVLRQKLSPELFRAITADYL